MFAGKCRVCINGPGWGGKSGKFVVWGSLLGLNHLRSVIFFIKQLVYCFLLFFHENLVAGTAGNLNYEAEKSLPWVNIISCTNACGLGT